jgi:hypothetical protein
MDLVVELLFFFLQILFQLQLHEKIMVYGAHIQPMFVFVGDLHFDIEKFGIESPGTHFFKFGFVDIM